MSGKLLFRVFNEDLGYLADTIRIPQDVEEEILHYNPIMASHEYIEKNHADMSQIGTAFFLQDVEADRWYEVRPIDAKNSGGRWSSGPSTTITETPHWYKSWTPTT